MTDTTWTTVTITRTIEIECRVAHVPGVRQTMHDPGEPEEFWVEADGGQCGYGVDGNGRHVELDAHEIEEAIRAAIRQDREAAAEAEEHARPYARGEWT
tara:strand:- start:339 stop:635 length:297 start_codon:yes stop_codon:yes gene_type:complete